MGKCGERILATGELYPLPSIDIGGATSASMTEIEQPSYSVGVETNITDMAPISCNT